MLSNQQQLISIIKQFGLEYGDFTLKSGAKSSYYLDLRKVMLHPEGLKATSFLITTSINSVPQIDAIGGIELGAVPIVAGVLSCPDLRRGITGFIIRKKAKEWGTERLVEGCVKPGQNVIIIEDVVTSGGSTIQAIQSARDYGLNVKGVLAVVDRMSGGMDNIIQALLRPGYEPQCRAKALLTVADLDING